MGEPEATRNKRFPVRWALKFGVSAILLGAILWLLPTDQVWGAILRIPMWLWAAVLMLFLAGHAGAAAKWWLLVAKGSNVAFSSALRAHFAGLAANLCLPGVAGGDVIRAGMVFRDSDSKARVALGSLADRLLDTIALLFLAGLGAVMTFGAQAFATGPLPLVVVFVFVLLAILGCALVAVILPRIAKGGMLAKLAMALEEFRRRPGRLALCLSLSILIQAGFVGLNVALATASGLTVPALAWYFAWPLAKLISIVPISLAGLGVREASLAALLAPLGADPAKVVAVGLLWQTVIFATGILGGIMLLLPAKPKGPGGAPVGFSDPLSTQHVARRDE
ncbi:MAG: flippase-like domain-containing protein [Gammaproteobacteria bacterium]|nr:flippase-like domain-containing protein [Gammaproteobacteria bacterium]MDH3410924.1 flippase-like domain-containing protein [Gammaproteobacteria bacterium]